MVTNKALSLFDNFNQLTPYAVGYDRIFDHLNNYVSNNVTSTGFPPYNIRKEGDYNYVIEMALAGFGVWSLVIPAVLLSPVQSLIAAMGTGWRPGWDMGFRHWPRIRQRSARFFLRRCLHPPDQQLPQI